MIKTLKIAAIGVLGLASAGALAQQATTERAPANPQMSQQMMPGGDMGGMMGMMHSPEMQKQMSEMMSNCNRMMERMGNMSAPNTNRN